MLNYRNAPLQITYNVIDKPSDSVLVLDVEAADCVEPELSELFPEDVDVLARFTGL